MEIPVIIPSHKRANRVETAKIVPGAIICVAKSQEQDYRRYNPESEICAHPDTVIGLAPKRNWIYRHFGSVMMLDDDLTSFRRMYPGPNDLRSTRIDPVQTVKIIQRTAEMAKELGAFLFGFSPVADGRNYKPQQPFKLTGYCNGSSFGLLKGSKVFFHHDAVAVEDYFASLVNAYYHRYAFFDVRYGFMQERTFKNPGGQAEFRSVKTEEQDFKFLRRMFGDVVQKRKENSRGQASHQWQRSIHIPF